MRKQKVKIDRDARNVYDRAQGGRKWRNVRITTKDLHDAVRVLREGQTDAFPKVPRTETEPLIVQEHQRQFRR
jgi:hypothetical protein